jgi:hypothetical protein
MAFPLAKQLFTFVFTVNLDCRHHLHGNSPPTGPLWNVAHVVRFVSPQHLIFSWTVPDMQVFAESKVSTSFGCSAVPFSATMASCRASGEMPSAHAPHRASAAAPACGPLHARPHARPLHTRLPGREDTRGRRDPPTTPEMDDQYMALGSIVSTIALKTILAMTQQVTGEDPGAP